MPYLVVAVTGDPTATAWQASVNGRTVSLIFVQSGSFLTGTYFETGASASKAFTGSVSLDRHLTLRTDDGSVTLDGTLEWPSATCVSASCVSMRLAATGGLAGGSQRDFTSVLAATPLARLSLPSDVQPVFGFPGCTAFAFDATSSVGLDLTYRLKFGDGEETSQAQASHVTTRTGSRIAELTVTDRFGRTNTTTARYGSIGLQSSLVRYYANASYDVRVTASGSQLTGEIIDRTVTPNRFLPASGSLIGARGLSFRSDDGTVSLDGAFEITTWYDPACTVAPNYTTCLNLRATVRGGALSGQTLVFRWNDGS